MSNMNSTYTSRGNTPYAQGTFVNYQVPVNNMMRYLQNSNSSGTHGIFTCEGSIPGNASYVNLLYDKTTPAIFSAFRGTSLLDGYHHFFVFGNRKDAVGFANHENSASNLFIRDSYFDLPKSKFQLTTFSNCIFDVTKENELFPLEGKIICEEMMMTTLCFSKAIEYYSKFSFMQTFIILFE
ncbi:hypothetical protein TVAG_235900 [Trichomonas vaginalis G3]|uniref:Uncharacterized protein n=1 Tax=Trichomonas vaginalis (strain ATCC PRA-98 / G3) TaxID=412133 RepID=A2FBE4_TRIV3|nr:hypothetical protein TVAGG3_0837470 [Trichomonas vaginalis G3]EAX97778.1 hypothetical protein TVAG_235900 [Trichomonas vaginalis G3]KAI5499033.1 hypothetical protein TVAGG3_0837470 [Trichomonas vaginalis G3]|eukprot:XP_001310708.1 hypothetical protein [Trichomonas vaginalis G3]